MRFGSVRSSRRWMSLAALAVLAAAVSSPLTHAQAVPAASTGPSPSRVDLFAGYGYFYPFNSDIAGLQYPSIPLGVVGSVAGYIKPHLGIQVEGDYFPNGTSDNNCAYSAQAGPILRTQRGRVVPFFHVLGGGAIVGGPRGQACNVWGWGVTGGGGVDFILPAFHDHLALRPLQVDFQYAQIDNGPIKSGGFYGGVGDIYAVRASAGLVLRLGDGFGGGHATPTFNCSAEPSELFPGDPITLTASTLSLTPRQLPKYIWTASGGKVAGDGAVAAIDTTGLAPGTYQVAGKLVEGPKQKLVASCSASFTIRAYEPPTLACQADKASVHTGDPVAITAVARSPQNRPLTFSYAATNGLIVGNGPSAGLSTVGVGPGTITVTCNVMDDKGLSASATTTVAVTTPPPPPPPPPAAVLPQGQPLCSITFDRDLKRPDRVDNEAKGCLDDIALALNRDPANKLLLVGSHSAKETNRNAAERAMNAADYLTKEKGIDPARLDLRIGPGNSRSVSMMLVPPGAVIDASDTSFDTSSIKRTGQAYGTARSTVRKPVVHRTPTKAVRPIDRPVVRRPVPRKRRKPAAPAPSMQ